MAQLWRSGGAVGSIQKRHVLSANPNIAERRIQTVVRQVRKNVDVLALLVR